MVVVGGICLLLPLWRFMACLGELHVHVLPMQQCTDISVSPKYKKKGGGDINFP